MLNNFNLYYFGSDFESKLQSFWDLSGSELKNLGLIFDQIGFNPFSYPQAYKRERIKKGDYQFLQRKGFTFIVIEGSVKNKSFQAKTCFFVAGIVDSKTLIDKIYDNQLAVKILNALPFDCQVKPKVLACSDCGFKGTFLEFDQENKFFICPKCKSDNIHE